MTGVQTCALPILLRPSKARPPLIDASPTIATTLRRGEHNLSLLLGLSQEENKYDDLSASGSDFENNDMSLMGHAKSNYSVGGTKTRSALRSLFGRVNYNYMMRYMIMASFRYDGSSSFAKGNKWGFFPSVSLGWNIANEPFWENLKETVYRRRLLWSRRHGYYYGRRVG